jgi:hypothetical protein
MYDSLFALDGFTVDLDLEERPPFVSIEFKTWKVGLFMPKVDPKIRIISGPEIMYLKRGERERERGEKKRGDEKGRGVQASPESEFFHL